MEYFNGILCIKASLLINNEDGTGVMSKYTYQNIISKCRKANINILIRRACRNTPALIAFDHLPKEYKVQLIEIYGDPRKKSEPNTTLTINQDPDAFKFFDNYILADGRRLPEKTTKQYCNDAAILRALRDILERTQIRRSKLGMRVTGFWPLAVKSVKDLSYEYPNTLPGTTKHLQARYREFMSKGYEALISKKFCNQNSRKVTASIENLLVALSSMPEKPYNTTVHEMYLKFINGLIEVVDEKTGELFNPKDFYKDGAPIEITETTVWNYLNRALNKITINRKTSGKLEFNSSYRPHHHRHKPEFSLSKVSLDDRDLPRKLPNGQRVKAYYAFDVTSGCVVGYAHSRDKDRELFLDCIRNMFRLLEKYQFGTPMQVEVEHHLVNNFRDGLMKAEEVFPFVRWCNAGNSQEKRAEHFNRAKKYGVEKKQQTDIGRPFLKLQRNRVKTEYGQKDKRYQYNELVADDMQTIIDYNNQPHPDQTSYPGLSRLGVLMENLNPDLPEINKYRLYKYIGEQTQTTIRRSQYFQLQGAKYQIENLEVFTRMAPNNMKVDAYYLPEEDGSINDVYMYQNGTYIGVAHKIETYNEATAEQTQMDINNYHEQAKYVSQFDKVVRESIKELPKLNITTIEDVQENENIKSEVLPLPEYTEDELKEDFNQEEFEDFLLDYTPEAIRARALNEL